MSMLKNTIFRTLITPFLLGLCTFALYIHHLSASVYGGDSGDFLSAIAVRGVAHPSGYPLYTLLGIIVSFLPIQQTLAWKVDILSALFASAAVVVFYAISYELIGSKITAVCTALTLAFLYPFWLFAEMSEVFALHQFFVLLLFYLGMLFYKRQHITYLYLLCFFFGLSLTNHESIVLLIPSLVIFVYVARKHIGDKPIVFKSLGLFLLGLLPYVYIPMAAFRNPPINWDHATNITNFFFLIIRGDYTWGKGITTTNTVTHLFALQNYAVYIRGEFPVSLICSIGAGIMVMILRKQLVFLSTILIAFLMFGPVFIFYGYGITTDIFSTGIEEKFYTTSLMFLTLFLPYTIDCMSKGIIKLLSFVSPEAQTRSFYPILFSCIFFVIPYVLLLKNFALTDLHNLTLGDKLGYDVLSALPTNSYLIVKGDNVSFNTLYMHYGQHIRPDVHIPATDSITSLVTHQIQSTHIQTTINPHDPAMSVLALLSVYSSAVHSPLIFATVNNYAEDIQKGETNLIPYGLVEKLATPSEQAMNKETFIRQQQKIFATLGTSPYTMPTAKSITRDRLIAEIPEFYATSYSNTGYYLLVHYHDPVDAKKYFEKALSLYPDTAIAYEGLGDYYLQIHNCRQAKDAYTKATTIDFLGERVYGKLYSVVNACLHDTKTRDKLNTFFLEYPTIFGNSIHSQVH